MSIPLIQEATKDAINTSIIAIKRNIERINMLLGLVDSGSPDLSGLATKQELEDAVNSLQPVDEVALNNMHSVSSNAVAKSLSYSTTEQKTGGKSTDGKDIYKMTITYTLASAEQERTIPIPNFEKEIRVYGTLYVPSFKAYFPIPYCYYDRSGEFYEVYTYIQFGNITIIPYSRGGTYFGAGSVVEVTIEYTKITD